MHDILFDKMLRQASLAYDFSPDFDLLSARFRGF
jgi:hypothetical protein